MADITFNGVTKVFDDGTTAVDQLDLRIADGEFMVLVGPSGSGKSTALRMLAGLADPTSGTIHVGDRDVTDLPPRDRDIAMVFQSYALYPHMSVAENMGFALKMAGVERARIDARVREVAERLGIESLLGRRPKQLSGGQRQRVALGRAIVRSPQAFLMDEPLSNVDAKLRLEMRAYLQALHRELRTTTVYVTHDQTEAMTMGQRVAVMRDGRLEQLDTPQALYERPANTFVASFIGSPAMNLVAGRVIGDAEIEVAGQRLALPGGHPALAGRAGAQVTVGLRPESVALSVNGAHPGATLDLPVHLTEALGSDLLVHLDVGGDTWLTARLPPGCGVGAGERVKLVVDPARLHFFDAETGAAIP